MTTEQIEREAEKRLRAIGEADPPNDLFYIDGDEVTKMYGDALHGCCELPRDLRAGMFHLLGRRPYRHVRHRAAGAAA